VLRFAQSPTHDLHIQDLRVALFNYIVSKQLNEKLLIRIDDTNKEENIEGKDKEILELLTLFSIEYEQVLYQSENLKHHQKMAMQLLTHKKAFSCFCSNDKLQELKQEAKKANKPYEYDGFCSTLSDETVLNVNAPFTVRIQKPDTSIGFKDVLKGEFNYEPYEVDAFIILKHDKTPTYNYACAIDDMLYNISTVIRQEKELNNTPKQIHVRQSLGYDKKINYIHLPKIAIANTKKNLNDEDISSVKWLIDEGFLPAAIANYLVLIGNTTPTEIFTLEEAISWFSIDNLKKEETNFDLEELRLLNQKHLKLLDNMRLSKLLGFADEDLGKLAKLYLEEVSTLKELKKKLEGIFVKKEPLKGFEQEFNLLKQAIAHAPFFEDFNEFKNHIIDTTELEEEKFSKLFRYLLTNEKEGPCLEKVYGLIKNYLGEITK
jgi:glutamyl-tRNA synthetase